MTVASSRPRTFRCEGIVLRHRDMGEADRLLTVLTPDRGLVRAVAKGARKSTSKTGGHLDLLRHVSLAIAESPRSSLATVSQVDTIESYRSLRDDLDRLSRGLYLAELAERFSVEEAAGRPLFDLLAKSLRELETTPAPDLLLRWFEGRLLALSGFAPQVQTCVECGAELEQREHLFSAERGGVVGPECKATGGDILLPAGVAAIKLLRHLARADWSEVERLRAGEEGLQQAERVLRAHLRNVLDHVVNSTAFMDEVRKRQGKAQA